MAIELNIRRASPWRGVPVQDDGVNFVQARALPLEMRERLDDVIYTTQFGDNLFNVATNFYGDPFLWWLIADKNIIDFPDQIEEGVDLIIPSTSAIQIELQGR